VSVQADGGDAVSAAVHERHHDGERGIGEEDDPVEVHVVATDRPSR
jgi:hypothetical protein